MAGYATGVLLMVAVGFLSWVELLFPAWVLALSLYRRGQDDGPGIVPT